VKRIEVWGTELALALRAEQDAHLEATLAGKRLEEAAARVEAIRRKIVSASNEETWMRTDEYDSLPSRRNAETEVIPFQDQPCPGPACEYWQDQVPHRHAVDGQIYALKINGIPQNWSS